MNISWQYLDKRNAAVSALKDYSSMKAIIANTNGDIAAVQNRMVGVGAVNISDMPKGSRNTSAGEDRIIKGIEEIDVLKERYRQALEFMDWFQPAWDTLADDERLVLEMFYLSADNNQLNAVYDICDHFHIERSSAYKKKDRALAHLAILLYGK